MDVVFGLPVVLGAWYLALSLVAYFLYARDKSAARSGRSRTPEATLHMVDLLGGWPGGLLAQRTLRHKTTKASFQFAFALTAAANLAVLWLLLRS